MTTTIPMPKHDAVLEQNEIPSWNRDAWICVVGEDSYLAFDAERDEWREVTKPGRAFRFEQFEDAKEILLWYIPDAYNDPHAMIVPYEPLWRLPGGTPATFLNVYELDRVYGGPEEGGWWVTTGTLRQTVICDEAEAERTREQMREDFPEEPAEGYKLGDYHYSGGAYAIEISTEPGKNFPEVWPTYE